MRLLGCQARPNLLPAVRRTLAASLSRAQPVWDRPHAPPWHGTGLALCKSGEEHFPHPAANPKSVTCPAQPSPHPLGFGLPDNAGAQPWGGELGGGFGGPGSKPSFASAALSSQTFSCGPAGAESSTRRVFSHPGAGCGDTCGLNLA